MNGRELYAAIWAGDRPERLPIQGVGPWGEALERWRSEGLDPQADHNQVLGLVGDDALSVPLNLNMAPTFPVRVLDLGAQHVTLVDEFGVTKRLLRSDYDRSQGLKTNAGQTSSMGHWLDFPVKDMRTWKAIYEARFRTQLDERLPRDWERERGAFVACAETRWTQYFSFPFGGLFSATRELIGWPNLAYILADDPTLIHSIVTDLVDFYLGCLTQLLADVRLDQITFFEDMSSTLAPLISPAMFRVFYAPGYRRLVGALREMGVQQLFIDSDGNTELLIPEFLACGLTGVHPCEVNAGMDVGALRAAYPTLCLNGGIDKRALVLGPEAIAEELARRCRVAWEGGRYTPALDHGAPPDISWAHVQSYARQYRAWCTQPQGV